jgi:hypothetical protein
VNQSKVNDLVCSTPFSQSPMVPFLRHMLLFLLPAFLLATLWEGGGEDRWVKTSDVMPTNKRHGNFSFYPNKLLLFPFSSVVLGSSFP